MQLNAFGQSTRSITPPICVSFAASSELVEKMEVDNTQIHLGVDLKVYMFNFSNF